MREKTYFLVNPDFILKAVLLSACFLYGQFTNAQSVISPTYYESTLASSNQVYTGLNVDMLELPGGGKLKAVCWDPYAPNPGVKIQVSNDLGGSVTISIPTSGESSPDVVIGNDLSNPSRYIVGVVFLNSNFLVTFNTYYIYGAATNSITYTFNTSKVISNVRAFFPHIDLFPDFNNPIGQLPSMHKFAIEYSQLDAPYFANVYETHGDMSNPTAFSPIIPITSSGSDEFADVAVSYDPTLNLQHVYVAFDNSTGLYETQLDLNPSLPPTAPPIGPPIVNFLSSNGYQPRIEAMAYNPSGSGIVPWVIAYYAFIGGNQEIFEFNPVIGGFDCTAGNATMSSTKNFAVAITGGLGLQNGNVCNENYNIGWYNPKFGYMTQVIDAHSGAISLSDPDYYVANLYPVSMAGTKTPIALSSCSNSGNYLFTGWWDGNGSIMYKLKAGITQYKPSPTEIKTAVDNELIQLYPNPVTSIFNIRGIEDADYKIRNIMGQIVLQGRINTVSKSINVAQLSSGIYTISLSGTNKIKSLKFIKE